MKSNGMRKTVAGLFTALLLTVGLTGVDYSHAMTRIHPSSTSFCTGWAILGLGEYGAAGRTDVTLSGGAMGSPKVLGPSVKVGIVNYGNLTMSGSSQIFGLVYLDSMSSYKLSGGSTISGGSPVQGAATDSLLGQAATGSLSLTPQATTLLASPQMSIIIKSPLDSMTQTGGSGEYVLDLRDLMISNGGTLILDAPTDGKFIINISGTFSLSGGSDITLSGGLTASSVLINVLGTGHDVAISGGSSVAGILVAPGRKITLSGGSTVNGELVGGGSAIVLSGASKVIDPCAP